MIVPKAGPRTWTVDTQTQFAIGIYFAMGITTTNAFLLTLRRFISNPSDFSEDLLPQSKGSKLAGDEDNRRGILQEPAEDSGIDSDDEVQRLRAQLDFEVLQLNETGSSDEELVLRSPKPKWAKRQYEDQLLLNESGSSDGELMLRSPRPKWSKRKYDDPMENMEEGQLDRELLIPMLVWQRPLLDDSDTMMPGSPDRSSPPLYEVELTASDEDDDGSVLELVIPLQSSKYNRLNSTPTTAYIVASLFCSMFCCFRD